MSLEPLNVAYDARLIFFNFWEKNLVDLEDFVERIFEFFQGCDHRSGSLRYFIVLRNEIFCLM